MLLWLVFCGKQVNWVCIRISEPNFAALIDDSRAIWSKSSMVYDKVSLSPYVLIRTIEMLTQLHDKAATGMIFCFQFSPFELAN